VIQAKGLYESPGLVDLHTHRARDMTALAVEAEPIAARSGTTTWVDAGSFGPDQVKGFGRFIVAPAKCALTPAFFDFAARLIATSKDLYSLSRCW
jgi:dihydroorotase